MKYYKKITGKRIYFSPIHTDDAETYIKWMNDETVAKDFGQYSSVVSSQNDLKWLFEPPADMQRYAIVLIDGDVMIGSISIHNIDHLNRNAFLGIFIGEKEYRSKGYGTEALRLILEYGFKTLNLHTIMLTVHADNNAGIACYNKIGFREVGKLPESIFKNGQYIDKLYMCVISRDFEL